MSVEEQIIKLKKDIERVNTRKIEVAARMKALEEEKVKLLQECEALGVDPKSIQDVIQQTEQKIQQEIASINSVLTNFNNVSRS